MERGKREWLFGKRKYFKMFAVQFPDYTTSLCTLLIWMLIIFVVFLVFTGLWSYLFTFYFFTSILQKTLKTLFPNGRVFFSYVYKYRWLNKLAKTISSNKQTNKQTTKANDKALQVFTLVHINNNNNNFMCTCTLTILSV